MNRKQEIRTFVELTKPRLTALAVMATGVGFLMGSFRTLDWPRLLVTLLGATLVGGGGNALNEWLERESDALMSRTKTRPLPMGRLQPRQALVFGVAASVTGIAILGRFANALTGWVGAATVLSYVGLYTPLKRRTAFCTLIGAIPGALPPVIGWTAARDALGLEAAVLFFMLFLWQLPHFLAIALMYRDEYAQAGFQVLPVIEPDGSSTARQMILYGLALLTVSLFPTILGVTGPVYFVGALLIGLWFFGTAVAAAVQKSHTLATRVFLASIGYLPAVLCLMILDRVV